MEDEFKLLTREGICKNCNAPRTNRAVFSRKYNGFLMIADKCDACGIDRTRAVLVRYEVIMVMRHVKPHTLPDTIIDAEAQ